MLETFPLLKANVIIFVIQGIFPFKCMLNVIPMLSLFLSCLTKLATDPGHHSGLHTPPFESSPPWVGPMSNCFRGQLLGDDWFFFLKVVFISRVISSTVSQPLTKTASRDLQMLFVVTTTVSTSAFCTLALALAILGSALWAYVGVPFSTPPLVFLLLKQLGSGEEQALEASGEVQVVAGSDCIQ